MISQVFLLRWDGRTGDFQFIKDLESTSILRPGTDYVETRISKRGVDYNSRGIKFYVVTTGEGAFGRFMNRCILIYDELEP